MTAAKTRTRSPARCHAQLACDVTGPSSRKRPRASILRARTRFRDSELRRLCRSATRPRSRLLPRSPSGAPGASANKENLSRPGSLTLCVKRLDRAHSPTTPASTRFFRSATCRSLNNHRVVCAIAVSSAVRRESRGALPHTQCDGRETCLTATCCGVQLNADTPSGTHMAPTRVQGPYIPHPMLNARQH